VMMQYSLLDRRPEEACLSLLQEHEIGVLARGSLAKGLLAGKPPEPYPDYTAEQVAAAAAAVAQLSLAGRTRAQTAVQYVLEHPAVSSAVAGIRTLQQLQELLVPVSKVLSADETDILRQTNPPNYYRQHR